MNAWGFVSVLTVVVALMESGWWLIDRFDGVTRKTVDRLLTLLEGRETLARDRFVAKQRRLAETARKALPPSAIVLPPDLEAVMMEESADWLREEMRQTYRKLYIEYGDWNKVRAAAGIGAMDA